MIDAIDECAIDSQILALKYSCNVFRTVILVQGIKIAQSSVIFLKVSQVIILVEAGAIER